MLRQRKRRRLRYRPSMSLDDITSCITEDYPIESINDNGLPLQSCQDQCTRQEKAKWPFGFEVIQSRHNALY